MTRLKRKAVRKPATQLEKIKEAIAGFPGIARTQTVHNARSRASTALIFKGRALTEARPPR